MSEVDLDDYVDLPTADALADAFTLAKLAAADPKPTLKEMINTVNDVRGEIEDGQMRLVATGAQEDPFKPYMRRAAVLAATANFLSLIASKQDAVKAVLRSRS